MSLKGAVRSAARTFGYEISKIKRPDSNVYDTDGLKSLHNHDFMSDLAFSAAYEYAKSKSADDTSFYGPWRVHIAIWAAQTALRRSGDFVECGVHRAFMSTAIMHYVDWNSISNGRRFFLVDTFSGVVKSLLLDEELQIGRLSQSNERYIDTFDMASRNTAEFKNAQLIQGAVPDILPSIQTSEIAYLHIDMNSAAPEVAAFEFFFPKMVTGGVILFDDYAYFGYEPQKQPLDQIAKKLGVQIASLPTGQGLLIK